MCDPKAHWYSPLNSSDNCSTEDAMVQSLEKVVTTVQLRAPWYSPWNSSDNCSTEGAAVSDFQHIDHS